MTQTFGPYTPIRKVGDFYFVSGQIGVNLADMSANQDVKTQTSQALDNMSQLLETQGLAMDHVVKTTIFVTDMNDFKEVNQVYETYFHSPRPARSTVQVAGLPKVAGDTVLKVEVEAVAYKEPS